MKLKAKIDKDSKDGHRENVKERCLNSLCRFQRREKEGNEGCNSNNNNNNHTIIVSHFSWMDWNEKKAVEKERKAGIT